jgi:hypothetical protein
MSSVADFIIVVGSNAIVMLFALAIAWWSQR